MRKEDLDRIKAAYADSRFASLKEAREYVSGETIKCLICGRKYKVLGGHLRVHELTIREYKEIFNIPGGVALATPACRLARSRIIEDTRRRGVLNTPHSDVLVARRKNSVLLNGIYRTDYAAGEKAVEQQRRHDELVANAEKLLAYIEKTRASVQTAAKTLGLTEKTAVVYTSLCDPRVADKYKQLKKTGIGGIYQTMAMCRAELISHISKKLEHHSPAQIAAELGVEYSVLCKFIRAYIKLKH